MKTEKFTVEGIGEFEFIIELPHTAFFIDSRKKMAELLGGARELLTLEILQDEGLMINPEGTQYIPREDADAMQVKIAYGAQAELYRAGNMCLMQDHIVRYPERKTLKQLSPGEYAIVEQEFVKQLTFFRNAKAEKATIAIAPNESEK